MHETAQDCCHLIISVSCHLPYSFYKTFSAFLLITFLTAYLSRRLVQLILSGVGVILRRVRNPEHANIQIS